LVDELLEVYQRLWAHARAGGVVVKFWPFVADVAGRYEHGEATTDEPRRDPLIRIVRRDALVADEDALPTRERRVGPTLDDDELRRELLTLAHEYGHFVSHWESRAAGGSARETWLAYHRSLNKWNEISARFDACEDPREQDRRRREAARRELDDTDREQILGEESTAWRHGRRTLEDLGGTESVLEQCDTRSRESLRFYRVRLGIEQPRPEDAHAAGYE
jgi:hypothetical protein